MSTYLVAMTLDKKRRDKEIGKDGGFYNEQKRSTTLSQKVTLGKKT